jgi:hypothetical protein
VFVGGGKAASQKHRGRPSNPASVGKPGGAEFYSQQKAKGRISTFVAPESYVRNVIASNAIRTSEVPH